MRIILCLFFLTFVKGVKSQNTIVEYTVQQDDQQYSDYLVYNQIELYNIIIAHKSFKNYLELINDKEYLESVRYTSGSKRNVDSNTFYIIPRAIGKQKFEVLEDNVPNFKWKISDKQETVLNYPCRIAYTEFRGRNYKAWFTTEIPKSLGPWKFFGLPGLILKVQDEDLKFIYTAVRIDFNSSEFIPQKFVKYFQNNTKITSYKDFIKLDNIYSTELVEKYRANLPAGVVLGETPAIRSLSIERTFEWEKQPEKP
ncbi:GLPGLI family protein [Halpernia humi]|uniref:GLPGLI family protein n=1 Tax=Halpernia humi TaxID=493375 RepID=A0A1H6AFE8_9FLAO|nr:GLPGLI family protein [Halpernia humi]SEG46476.1 GLPGLI family protein [Halpernia humi]